MAYEEVRRHLRADIGGAPSAPGVESAPVDYPTDTMIGSELRYVLQAATSRKAPRQLAIPGGPVAPPEARRGA